LGFIIFFSYFFLSASIVAFEDGFDETVIEKGYPADFSDACQWNQWEYLAWAMNWLPIRYYIKFKNFFLMGLEEDEKKFE
jgi:hypothetical protein